MPVITKFDFENLENILILEEKRMEPIILNHPLIQHKLAYLRRKETDTRDFRDLTSEIAMLMCFEATRDLELEEVEIETPMAKCTAKVLKNKQPAIIPILRAGLGMVDGMLKLLPSSKVGHIGLYRDPETSEPIEYYAKFPDDIAERQVFVVDPMLATGGSAIDAIGQIKKRGVKHIHFMCMIAAPEGLKALTDAHPDVQVICAALDDHLNEHNYIIPGLGDAGDRIFGTK